MSTKTNPPPAEGRPYVSAGRHRKLRESRDRLRAEKQALEKRLAARERRISELEARLERSKRAGLARLADWQHEYIGALERLRLHPEQDAALLERLRELRGRRER